MKRANETTGNHYRRVKLQTHGIFLYEAKSKFINPATPLTQNEALFLHLPTMLPMATALVVHYRRERYGPHITFGRGCISSNAFLHSQISSSITTKQANFFPRSFRWSETDQIETPFPKVYPPTDKAELNGSERNETAHRQFLMLSYTTYLCLSL